MMDVVVDVRGELERVARNLLDERVGGSIRDVLACDSTAVAATLNVVMRYTGLIEKTDFLRYNSGVAKLLNLERFCLFGK